jgi:hypothetical protein
VNEEKLRAEIEAYDKNIDQYRKALQTESVWLFLAILGCWSVIGNGYLQAFAFCITIVFFSVQVASHLTHRNTFNSFESRIKKLIEREFISGSVKDHYLEKFGQLKEKRASKIQALKAAPMFSLCFIFLFWSIYDQIVLQLLG